MIWWILAYVVSFGLALFFFIQAHRQTMDVTKGDLLFLGILSLLPGVGLISAVAGYLIVVPWTFTKTVVFKKRGT